MSLLYTDSMLAMDVNTGKLAWYHQFIPGESFDIDEHYEFINVDIPGYAHKSGFEMGKAGVLWHLDRETGQLIRAMDTGLQNMMNIDPERGFVELQAGGDQRADGQAALHVPEHVRRQEFAADGL